jgi:uncharacterized protein YodC (DUF2158 family)
MIEFKEGDKILHVFLSGPIMRVQEIYDNDIECHWFDKNNAYHKVKFKKTELKEVEKPRGVTYL